MKQNILKLLAVIGLLVLCELFYQITNKTELFLDFVFDYKIASLKQVLETNKSDKVSKDLVNIFQILKIQMERIYPNEFQNKLSKDDLNEIGNWSLSDTQMNQLREFDWQKIPRNNTNSWAVLFYKFGIEEYKNNNTQKTESYWKMAISLAPEWSQLHLELANLENILGRRDAYEQTLDYCLKFKFPARACQFFKEENLAGHPNFQVGDLSTEIQAIYDTSRQ